MGPGETAADFLTIYSDARPAALGGAYTALSDNAAGLAYNSAGLVRAEAREITVSYAPWIGDGAFHHMSYTHPMGGGNDAFGLSLLYFDAGSFLQTNELGITNGHKLISRDIAVTAGYARKFGRFLSVGGSAKYITRKLDVYSASAAAVDLGVIYWPPIENLMIGASIQNIGSSLQFITDRASLPLTFRVGASYQTFLDRILFVGDFIKVIDEDYKFSLGSEVRVAGALKLRAGWQKEESLMKGFTLGVGMSVMAMTLDYAYIPFDGFESAHKLTGSVQFGGPTKPDIYRAPPPAPVEIRQVPPPVQPREIRVMGADTVPVRIRIMK